MAWRGGQFASVTREGRYKSTQASEGGVSPLHRRETGAKLEPNFQERPLEIAVDLRQFVIDHRYPPGPRCVE